METLNVATLDVATLCDQVMVCPRCKRLSMAAGAAELCPVDGHAPVPRSVRRAHPSDDLLGRVLDDRYALVDVLDASQQTYIAVQLATGRKVALRVARSGQAGGEWSGMRVYEEMRRSAELTSPASVTCHDAGDCQGLTYAVFELLRGRTLAQVVAISGPFSAARVHHIALQLLHALREAHALGLDHGDLGPDRVLLVDQPFHENRVKVLGFGLARMDRPHVHPDAAGDLVALGHLLAFLLTGAAAGAARDETERLGGPLAALVARATAAEPAQRFASAFEMDRALRAITPGTTLPLAHGPTRSPASTRRPAPLRLVGRLRRARPHMTDILVGASALLVGGLLTLATLPSQAAGGAPPPASAQVLVARG